MYPTQNEIDLIDFLQRTKNIFENYLTDREKIITQREKEIAILQVRHEEILKRAELLKKFSTNFFKQRSEVQKLAMTALDIAIENGDEKIATFALDLVGDEFSKDFFTATNKISGIYN